MFVNYSWEAALANFKNSLEVMGLAMLSIFVVIGVIYGSVVLLARLTRE